VSPEIPEYPVISANVFRNNDLEGFAETSVTRFQYLRKVHQPTSAGAIGYPFPIQRASLGVAASVEKWRLKDEPWKKHEDGPPKFLFGFRNQQRINFLLTALRETVRAPFDSRLRRHFRSGAGQCTQRPSRPSVSHRFHCRFFCVSVCSPPQDRRKLASPRLAKGRPVHRMLFMRRWLECRILRLGSCPAQPRSHSAGRHPHDPFLRRQALPVDLTVAHAQRDAPHRRQVSAANGGRRSRNRRHTAGVLWAAEDGGSPHRDSRISRLRQPGRSAALRPRVQIDHAGCDMVGAHRRSFLSGSGEFFKRNRARGNHIRFRR
jgi:hypothetical protein